MVLVTEVRYVLIPVPTALLEKCGPQDGKWSAYVKKFVLFER
jgi:hypothetical protein